VHAGSGSITKGGTPAGKCLAASAAGALDAATHHNWNGSWSAKYQALSVTAILGEKHLLTPTSKDYWSVWVNNGYSPSGVCGIKLKAGEQLLFAAVPDKGVEYPLVLEMPTHAAAGQTFHAKVIYYNATGKAKPVAGATVSVNGHSGATSSNGTVPLSTGSPGTYVFHATKHGFIRAATVTVHIS
jgi:hypothetical protein